MHRVRDGLKKLLIASGLALFVTVVFAGALLATMPATVVTNFVTLPAQVTGLYGSVWRGRADLLGGHTLAWTVNARSLALLQLRMDVTLQGPDTQATGRAMLTPWSVSVQDLTGRAGAGLLQLLPDVPIKGCSARAVLDVRALRMTRDAASSDGRIVINEGTCIDTFDRTQTVPQMQVDLLTQGRDAVAVLTDKGGQLARITVAGDRRLIVRVEPEGATLIPGLPTSGPIILEYPF